MTSRQREDHVLSRIISTVGSSLELDEVLAAVVELLSDASAVRACFVYLVDESGDQLVLRAAGEPYAHLVGTVSFPRGASLAWWALEHREPAFIRENALDDPRTVEVPAFEEDRFQSLVAVPVLSRAGAEIGAITAHTEAPREFTDDEVAFLVTVARLVAGAIENARNFQQTRRRVHELEALTELAEAIAGADTFDELLPEAVGGARDLLGATACHLYLIEPGGDQLVLARSSPDRAGAARRIGLATLGPQLAPRARGGRLTVPLVAEDELVGLVVAEGTRSVELARAIASQLAVGIRKVRLIERLTERTLVTDFLDELASGRHAADLDGRAARLGCDLAEPHVVVAADPGSEALEEAIRGALTGALIDRHDDRVRALVRVPRSGGATVAQALAPALAAVPGARAGISDPCSSPVAYAEAFDEAGHALAATALVRGAATVARFGDLGAYRYLLRIAEHTGSRDETVERVQRLAAYDAERSTQLLTTLEEFLHRHGSIAATAEALFVHQNTLRQRLRRIADIADLDLRSEDWLTLEIAVKLVRIRDAHA